MIEMGSIFGDPDGTLVTETTFGRIAVVAFCTRNTANTAYGIPTLSVSAQLNAVAGVSIIARLKAAGVQRSSSAFKIKIAADAISQNHGLYVNAAAVKKTASGSNTVLSSAAITFNGGSAIADIASGAEQESDQISMTFDSSHDYYFIFYCHNHPKNGYLQNSSSPVGYVDTADFTVGNSDYSGDQTGITTIPGYGTSVTTWRLISGFTLIGSSVGGSSLSGLAVGSFTEIDPSSFYPGQSLRASTMRLIADNCREAMLTPEFFGPVAYADADTIPLPTSTVDGYAYSRAELQYVWEWSDTTNASGSHLRVPIFYASINQSTGVVTLNVWRLPPGGPWTDTDNTRARITVLVIAHRERSHPSVSIQSIVAPSDATTSTIDDSSAAADISSFLVNGS
jgi:hypothetical protein